MQNVGSANYKLQITNYKLQTKPWPSARVSCQYGWELEMTFGSGVLVEG
jgi:hypothetical protein